MDASDPKLNENEKAREIWKNTRVDGFSRRVSPCSLPTLDPTMM